MQAGSIVASTASSLVPCAPQLQIKVGDMLHGTSLAADRIFGTFPSMVKAEFKMTGPQGDQTPAIAAHLRWNATIFAKNATATALKMKLVVRRMNGHAHIMPLVKHIHIPGGCEALVFGPKQAFDLHDIVRSMGGLGTRGLSIHLARQVLLAVRDMHRRQIAHKDLKLECVNFDSKFRCRIGCLQQCVPTHGADGRPLPTKQRGGTRCYSPPEALRCLEHQPAQADAWSLGMLLFILVVGRPPWRMATMDDAWFKTWATGSK
jgi:serine/threonine protein kinase